MKNNLFFGIILALSFQLQAQEKGIGIPMTTEAEWLPATSLYIELGGRVLYSLNIDFRRRENFALGIGASFIKEDADNSEMDSQSMFFPSVMGYYLGGKRHRLELGGGLCPGIGSSEGLAAMALYGTVGYRIQKKKGLIFRVGFTPFLAIPVSKDDSFAVVPWAAISLGYSF